MSEKLFVVFDGPPSHESGRFVEVENESGQGRGGLVWDEMTDGYWRLGPFVDAREIQRQVLEARISELKWASDNLNMSVEPSAILGYRLRQFREELAALTEPSKP